MVLPLSAQWTLVSNPQLTSGFATIDRGTQSTPVTGIRSFYTLSNALTDAVLNGYLNRGFNGEEEYNMSSVYGKLNLTKFPIGALPGGQSVLRGADAGLFEVEYTNPLVHGETANDEAYVSGVRGVLNGSGPGITTEGAVSAVTGLDNIKNNTFAGYFDGDIRIVNGALDIFSHRESWTRNHWRVGIKSPLATAWVSTNTNENGDYMGIGMTGSGWYFIKSTVEPGEVNDPGVCNYPFYVTENGKTITREVEVTLSGWCDYVFDDNYQLRTIGELESFIEENHHLPEVPSEQEVLENGVNLGEMDAILLKKIEELTLYLIEQDKKIEEQEVKIKALEAQKQH